MINKVRGYILNGAVKEDEGEFTYVGARGSTVIDYAIVNDIDNDIVKILR